LHDACLTGILDYVRVLVEANSNVNASNNYGITPLMDACYAGNAEIIEFLLEHGLLLQSIYS
jgi:ankyrin repeat protein